MMARFLECERRVEDSSLIFKAVAPSGRTQHPSADYGFRYDHGLEDIDSHVRNRDWAVPQA